MSDYRKLLVWRKAHALVLRVDRVAGSVRGGHRASLRAQLLRAAMSIPTNIVEGRGQRSDGERVRFLRYALNSASELEYHLQLAGDLGAVPADVCRTLMADAGEVRRMLHGLIARMSARDGR